MNSFWLNWLVLSQVCSSLANNGINGYPSFEMAGVMLRQSSKPFKAESHEPQIYSPNIVQLVKVESIHSQGFELTHFDENGKMYKYPIEQYVQLPKQLILRTDADKNVICWLEGFDYYNKLSWAVISCLWNSENRRLIYLPISDTTAVTEDIDFQVNAKAEVIYWREGVFHGVYEYSILKNSIQRVTNIQSRASQVINPTFAVDVEENLVFYESNPGNVLAVRLVGGGNYTQNSSKADQQVLGIALDKPGQLVYFWYNNAIRMASYEMAKDGKYCKEYFPDSSANKHGLHLQYHHNFLYWLSSDSKIQSLNLGTKELLTLPFPEKPTPFAFSIFQNASTFCNPKMQLASNTQDGEEPMPRTPREPSPFKQNHCQYYTRSPDLDCVNTPKLENGKCICSKGMIDVNSECINVHIFVPVYDQHSNKTWLEDYKLSNIFMNKWEAADRFWKQISGQPKLIATNEASRQFCWIPSVGRNAICANATNWKTKNVQVHVNTTLLVFDQKGTTLFWNNEVPGCITMHIVKKNLTYDFECVHTPSITSSEIDTERKVLVWADSNGGISVNVLQYPHQSTLHAPTSAKTKIQALTLDIYHGRVYFIQEGVLRRFNYIATESSSYTADFVFEDVLFRQVRNLLYYEEYLIGHYATGSNGIVVLAFDLQNSVRSPSTFIQTNANYESSSILLYARIYSRWENPCDFSNCVDSCIPCVQLSNHPKPSCAMYTCIPSETLPLPPTSENNEDRAPKEEKEQIITTETNSISEAFWHLQNLSSETVHHLIVYTIFLFIVPASILLILVHTGRTFMFQKLIRDFTTMSDRGFKVASTEMERILVAPVQSVVEPLFVQIRREKILCATYPHITYEATYDNHPVTAKTIKPTFNLDNLKTFLDDIRILDYVNHHSNILAFFGAEISQINRGILYAVQEHSMIGTLESYLREHAAASHGNRTRTPVLASTLSQIEPLTSEIRPNLLLSWCKQIASGMEHLSIKHILHTDLRTQNVLVFDRGLVKVTNFTLSKRKYTYSDFQKYGRGKIPWRWTAYESLLSYSFTYKSDVWSYAITLWELFTLGQIPFLEHTWEERGKFVRRLNTGLRPPKPEKIPEAIYTNIMEPSWDREPECRPTFSQIIDRLSRIQKLAHPEPSSEAQELANALRT